MKITWLGHNTWTIETAAGKILLDPFLDDSPTAPLKSDAAESDFLIVSHGHFDHVGDAVPIAQRTGATVVANFEVGNWLAGQGVLEEKLVQLNPGGGADLPFGRVAMTIAHHSSSLPDGSYGGVACGVLLNVDGKRLYFACDTALFLDMKLIGAGGLDLAVVPIGDRFTMGPDDAVEAVKLLSPRLAAPCHYGTWPPIKQDASAWAEKVRRHTAAEPLTPAAGESFDV
ncbi:MAG: metal-dependent hydrolase [Planctomycetota bacterium]